MNGKIEENIKISVIMNCFNSDEFLKEAIESLLNQTYHNFECIFWDNQSTDTSANIIKSYADSRIKYFYADQFTSLGEARNLAISKASGDWIAFLDADDLWHPQKLSSYIYELKNNKDKNNVSMIYSKTKAIDSSNNIIGQYSRHDSGFINTKLLKDGNFIVQSSIMVKLQILKDIGGINPVLKYCPDYDLLLKITKNYVSIGIDEFLTFYRIHSNSITSRKVYDNSIEEIDFLINYLVQNPQKRMLHFFIYKNIVYKVTSFFIKLLLDFDFRIIVIIKKYFYFLIFSPFIVPSIIIKKISKLKSKSINSVY